MITGPPVVSEKFNRSVIPGTIAHTVNEYAKNINLILRIIPDHIPEKAACYYQR